MLTEPPRQPPQVSLPLGTVGQVSFVDEACKRGTQGLHFVTAAIKIADPDRLPRQVKAVLDRRHFVKASEVKFPKVAMRSVPILGDVMRASLDAGSSSGAFVFDKRHFDPWAGKPTWLGHLFATERLPRGMATRREIGSSIEPLCLISWISLSPRLPVIRRRTESQTPPPARGSVRSRQHSHPTRRPAPSPDGSARLLSASAMARRDLRSPQPPTPRPQSNVVQSEAITRSRPGLASDKAPPCPPQPRPAVSSAS